MKDHIVFTQGPDEKWPRHSEGAFLRLGDGRIMLMYSRFSGGQADDAASDLAVTYSSDEGETWGAPETAITAASFGVRNIMSVSLLRMTDGSACAFYIVKADAGVSKIVLSRSHDEGRTWTAGEECTLADRRGYFVLNNDRVERLASGRLVMPLTYHRGGHQTDGSVYFDGRGVAVFLLSDDDGATWREAKDTVSAPFTGSDTGLQENGVVEMKNGLLWGYSRTDRMYQYEYFSLDGGERWTQAQPSRFTSPPSPMKIARSPKTGDMYAVWNPIPNYNGRALSRAGWGRMPIVWAKSGDEGRTWTEPRVIEGAEDHGYCYPALFFTDDGAMLVAYCAGGPADGICLARLSVMKVGI